MNSPISDIAFTASVKEVQKQMGLRTNGNLAENNHVFYFSFSWTTPAKPGSKFGERPRLSVVIRAS